MAEDNKQGFSGMQQSVLKGTYIIGEVIDRKDAYISYNGFNLKTGKTAVILESLHPGQADALADASKQLMMAFCEAHQDTDYSKETAFLEDDILYVILLPETEPQKDDGKQQENQKSESGGHEDIHVDRPGVNKDSKPKTKYILPVLIAAVCVVVLFVLIKNGSSNTGENKTAEKQTENVSTVEAASQTKEETVEESTTSISSETGNSISVASSDYISSGSSEQEKNDSINDESVEETEAIDETTAASDVETNNMEEYVVGDYITFGSYEQDNDASNGKEDIEWLVLDKEDDRVLVISKYALDCQMYNEKNKPLTWSSCSLRSWLNSSFIDSAFSSDEQSQILIAAVTADSNPNRDVPAGKDTEDKVFLLSIKEAEQYFDSDEARWCVPTSYARACGASVDNVNTTADGEGTCLWWLRTPGTLPNYAAYVDNAGSVSYDGHYVSFRNNAVRPALWISP